MTHTKQTAKKTTGSTAPCRRIPLCPQCLSLNAAHDKAVKKNSIHMPPHQWPTDLEAGVSAHAKQTMAVNAGHKALVSLQLAVIVPASICQFCFLCQDGSDLYQCKACPCTMCMVCMLVPQSHQEVIKDESIKFQFMSCHWLLNQCKKEFTPYMVSIYIVGI